MLDDIIVCKTLGRDSLTSMESAIDSIRFEEILYSTIDSKKVSTLLSCPRLESYSYRVLLLQRRTRQDEE